MLNAGTIDVRSGTFNTNGLLTNGATGLISGAGTISGSMSMSGGALAPGNSGVGTLTIYNASFFVNAASTLNIEISGATADKLVFQSPAANPNIGSGLLALSISLLSAPTPGTTYSIVGITSSPLTLTGTFAGLPTTGSSLTAYFGGQGYVFSVNYLSNAITMDFVPVPEPSTWALLAGGAAMLGLKLRRRRAVAEVEGRKVETSRS
jgi:hypothetical protein